MGRPGVPILNTPVTAKENFAALFWDKHPWWLPTPGDSTMIISPLYDNLLGRGGFDGTTDAFGIDWEFIPSAGGSIVRPGEPFISDANEIKDKIKFPDIDKWDWAAEVERNKLDPRISTMFSLVNGFWFERLISFMDFAPAAMALLDEDQEAALKNFFEESTAFACKVVDKFCENFPALDGFNIHDDWGAQRAPFFSNDIAYEFFVPNMKTLTDHIHSKGKYVTLHSCGHVEDRVQCFIDGGFDGWDPQTMNDTYRLFDEVGDKISISIVPESFDPETTPEEKQREMAKEFAQRFCKPGKPCAIGYYGASVLTPAYQETLYEESRKIYHGK
jgi:hypothetical protein